MKFDKIYGSNLSISFGDEKVLRDFGFEIGPKQHTVFKGESGSGKSTLLKLLLGFLSPDTGRMQLNQDRPIRELRNYAAWLPQDLDLGAGKVWEVMQTPFEFRANRTLSPEKSDMKKVLERLGIRENSLYKSYRNLSTGQRQRVGLATCHLLDKPVLLLDEPTSALDSKSKHKVYRLLIERQPDRTVISTSHDPEWLETADRIIELD